MDIITGDWHAMRLKILGQGPEILCLATKHRAIYDPLWDDLPRMFASDAVIDCTAFGIPKRFEMISFEELGEILFSGNRVGREFVLRELDEC